MLKAIISLGMSGIFLNSKSIEKFTTGSMGIEIKFGLKKIIIFFSVRLLLVLRGHSVFSSPPQRQMTSDFEGFSIPDFIHYICLPILILEKEPAFSLLNAQC